MDKRTKIQAVCTCVAVAAVACIVPLAGCLPAVIACGAVGGAALAVELEWGW